MALYCVGCGDDILDSRVKRSLYTDASKHVKPLWCKLFDEELENRGMEAQAQGLITSSSGKMCRRCFTVFERCAKLLNSVKQDVAKTVEIFQQNGLLTVNGETINDKWLALATNSASPAVVVNNKNVTDFHLSFQCMCRKIVCIFFCRHRYIIQNHVPMW